MLIPDLMVLARRKLGPGARYFFSVDRSGDRAHATAEVFCSARPGANVPDERKTARIVGRAPFVPLEHDHAGTQLLDPSRDAAVLVLAKTLATLPDAP